MQFKMINDKKLTVIVFMHFWMVKNLVFGVFWLFLAISTPKGHNSLFHPEV